MTSVARWTSRLSRGSSRVAGNPSKYMSKGGSRHLTSASYSKQPDVKIQPQYRKAPDVLFKTPMTSVINKKHGKKSLVTLENGRLISTKDDEGKGYKNAVPLQWLRDHCQCDKCIHPVTKQRLIDTFNDIPADISTSSITEVGEGYAVTWSDGHESFYAKEWLEGGSTTATQAWVKRQGHDESELWTGESIKSAPPTVDYAEVMASDKGVLEWLGKVKLYGFCYVENTPVDPEETQRLLERISYIRHTHYGGFWDFTADLSKGDTAYTQLAIGPHTDNTYFSDPAGLQLFHLLSHTDGEGGASTLVDGFAAAQRLFEEDFNSYLTLAKTPVYAHASGNEDSSIQPHQAFPTLVHDAQSGILTQIRWNNSDRAHVDTGLHRFDQWYKAARKWSNILDEISFTEQLKPGKALIFDNWRVLHARTAFTGKRRMCGGYINRDDWISRHKMLKFGREEVLKQVSSVY